MRKVPISIVLIARNEEHNLKDCLESCAFAEEIIVVDDNSEDKTVEIAKSFGAKVYTRSLAGDWGAQQTFAISKATQKWIFLIDADERCSEDLCREIIETVERGEKYAYFVHRENRFHYHHATHGVLRPDEVARLFPNEGVTVEGYVHPQIKYSFKKKLLKSPLYHYTYTSWDQYYRKLNQYAALAAQKQFDKGRKANFCFDVLLKPVWAFIKVYFLNLGFLDGRMGLMLSLNHYSYTLQKYIRLYTLNKTAGKL